MTVLEQLLRVQPSDGIAEEDASVERLLRAASSDEPSNVVRPEPGFVVKTAHAGPPDHPRYPLVVKVFINLCHSALLPAPPPASDDDIARALQSDNPAAYRVPLSMSDIREDTDKRTPPTCTFRIQSSCPCGMMTRSMSICYTELPCLVCRLLTPSCVEGNMCIVIDACVNSDVLERASTNESYRSFICSLAIEWASQKHNLVLRTDYSLPKMKVKGTVVPHTIRRPTKPVIKEIISTDVPVKAPTMPPQKTVPMKHHIQPAYNLVSEPLDVSTPDFLVLTMQLPNLYSTAHAALDVEPNRLLFHDTKTGYFLDIELPHSVNIESVGAQFLRPTHELVVTLPIDKTKDEHSDEDGETK